MSEIFPDIDSILPYGESLLPLIYSSFLTNGNLNQLLKNRGVYISSPDKESTIPIFKNIIISPSEFNFLREQQKTKEDRKKSISEDISFDSDDSLFDLTSDDHFNANDILEGERRNIRIEGVSSINVENLNHLYYEYELLRNDISKDWANSKSKHYGRVDFIKNENIISVNSDYTSDETKWLNNQITKRIKKKLSEKKGSNKLKTTKVTFDSFTNENRINFLFSFLESKDRFELFKITDISFGPDPKKQLQDQAKWMENRVKKLSVTGEGLNELEYFAEKKHCESLLIENIEAQFKFIIDSSNLIVKIKYGFPSYFRTEIPDTIFEFSVQSIQDESFENKYNDNIRRTIQEIFTKIKIIKFNEFKKK